MNNTMNFSSNPEFKQLLLNECQETEHLKCKRANSQFRIISYKKSALYQNKDSVDFFGHMRSVIVNEANEIVCVSPGKSIPENLVNNSFVAEEFVEGTMINVFYDHTRNVWELATRGSVGGLNRFYTLCPCFRDLFFDAASCAHFDINSLKKELCYSFVLQHPLNEFVKYILTPRLYLVAVYQVEPGTGIVHYIHNYKKFNFVPRSVHYPRVLKEKDMDSLRKAYCSLNPKKRFDIMGFVLKDVNTGIRYKCRNEAYEYALSLRKNQPNLQLLYRALCRERKIKEFFRYYPHYKPLFDTFRNNSTKIREDILFRYYVCFVQKNATLSSFKQPIKNILYQLHKVYLEQLKPNNLKLTADDVALYFETLDDQTFLHIENKYWQTLESEAFIYESISQEEEDTTASDSLTAFAQHFIPKKEIMEPSHLLFQKLLFLEKIVKAVDDKDVDAFSEAVHAHSTSYEFTPDEVNLLLNIKNEMPKA